MELYTIQICIDKFVCNITEFYIINKECIHTFLVPHLLSPYASWMRAFIPTCANMHVFFLQTQIDHYLDLAKTQIKQVMEQ